MGRRTLANLDGRGDLRAVAAWDPDPAALAGLDLPVTGSAEELAARGDVDLVYVASPPAHHLGQLRAALTAGKAVFCEKPLAVDVGDAEAAVAEADAMGARAAVNFPFASAPAFLRIVQAVAAGELGTLERIAIGARFRVWPRPWQADATWLARRDQGGFTREVLSHFLFAARRLGGALSLESADVAWPGDAGAAEIGVTARLRAGGVPVTVDGGVSGPVDDDNEMVVTGTRGAYRLHGWYRLQRRDGDGWADIDVGPPTAQLGQLDRLPVLIEGRESGLATLREALDVQRAVEGILAR